MSKRDMYVIGIALMCGIVGFIFSFNLMKKAQRKPMPSYKCVVAQADIKKGTVLDAKNIAVGGPFQMADASNIFLQVDDAGGYTALEDIPKGAVVTRVKVKRIAPVEAPTPEHKKPTQTFLPIPQGMRGFPLASNQVEGFPAGMKTGAYVDIYGMVTSDGGRMERRCIVKGGQVVMVEENPDSGVASIAVALPPRAVDIVMKAVNDGKVRLVPGPDPGGKMTFTSFGYAEIIRGVSREKAFQSVSGTAQNENKKKN